MSVTKALTVEYESQMANVAVKKLFKDERTADVHFVFKSGERVPAHKNLLAAASKVFDAMFYGLIKEKGDVQMDEVSAAGFVVFLQFFYSNKVKLTMANIDDVMNYGHKYDVTVCFNLCVRFLLEHLSVDNVLEAHSLAILFEQKDLQTKCESFIKFQTEEVLQSPSFLARDQQALKHILKQDELSCSETVMSWMKAASKQKELTKDIIQEHLGDLFYKIRYRSLRYDEFVDLLPDFDKLFTRDELIEIFQMMQNDQFQPKVFNGLRRTPVVPLWDEEAAVKCWRSTNFLINEPLRIRNVETMTFTTNKPLTLGYFECVEIAVHQTPGTFRQLQTPLSADVVVVKVPNGAVGESVARGSGATVLQAWKVELHNRTTKIDLPKPISIDPKFKYEIRINIDILEDYCVYWQMKTNMQLEDDIIVTFHNDPMVNGKARALVHSLGFNQLK